MEYSNRKSCDVTWWMTLHDLRRSFQLLETQPRLEKCIICHIQLAIQRSTTVLLFFLHLCFCVTVFFSDATTSRRIPKNIGLCIKQATNSSIVLDRKGCLRCCISLLLLLLLSTDAGVENTA